MSISVPAFRAFKCFKTRSFCYGLVTQHLNDEFHHNITPSLSVSIATFMAEKLGKLSCRAREYTINRKKEKSLKN